MSRDMKQNLEHSTIDAILKGLTSRPNVESTLILSRKDGTIIRTTGFPQSETSNTTAGRVYERLQSNGTSDSLSNNPVEALKAEDAPEKASVAPSPAQHLAAAIYEFVIASSKVAASVSQSGAQATRSAGELSHSATREAAEQSTVSNEEDVQLLRMRTRRQEIIIFPDPSYLCCVVQNLSRVTSNSEIV